MKYRSHTFLLLNILIPILIGVVIYCFISPEVDFIKIFQSVTCIKWCRYEYKNNDLCRFIRNYLPDMLWAYSLIFSAYAVFDNKTKNLKWIIIAVSLLIVIIEILQLTKIIHGTFDIFDILAEITAVLIAVIILKRTNKEEENEKK